MAATENWYAVKARPGTQKKASPRVSETAERKGEFIIERSLRDAGFEVFMPSTVREVRHHRTDEYLVKRFPLMVGYAFVKSPRDFYALSDCDGVSAILGVAGCPHRIGTADIEAIREAEALERETMERRRARRLEKEKQANRKLTRKEAREIYPKNHRIVVKGTNYLSGMTGFVTDATGRSTIKAMVETLNGLIAVELDIADFAEAV